MKRSYYQIAESKAWNAHIKAEAIRYLLENFNKHGSSDRDESAISGLALILEEISNDAHMAADILSNKKRHLGTEVEIGDPQAYPEIKEPEAFTDSNLKHQKA